MSFLKMLFRYFPLSVGQSAGTEGRCLRPMRRSAGLGRCLGVAGCVLVSGCSGSGFGDEVRRDMQKQMESVQPRITECYKGALERDRKLQGEMMVAIRTEAGTGKFSDVSVQESELNDEQLQQCVVEQVSSLSLEKPTKSPVSTEYPLNFFPSN